MAANPACKSFLELLSPFIDGELSAAQRTSVERHLAACPDCPGRVADLRAESGLIRVGLDMAADDVDFSDFAQKVMARVTPERPPLWERLKLSLSERFTYQRGPLLAGAMAMAVLLLVAVPLLTRKEYPPGYANQYMTLDSVETDPEAHVSPVVFYSGHDTILWLVPHPDHDEQMAKKKLQQDKQQQDGAKKPGQQGEDEEEGVQPAAPHQAVEPSHGGEL